MGPDGEAKRGATLLGRLFLTGLAILAAGWALGCGFTTPSAPPSRDLPYDFHEEVRVSRVSFPGTLVSASSTNISLRQGAWGRIGWLEEEGAFVASGALVAVIDMADSEDQMRVSESNLRVSRAELQENLLESPKTMAESEAEVQARIRDLELRQRELEWLRAGPRPDERWRAETDLAAAALSCSFSRQLYEAQRAIADRGFDSPFSLRQKELDLQAREIERSYNRQRLTRLLAGPFPEEIAKGVLQVEVASGEADLAADKSLSASATSQVSIKEGEYAIEVNSSELRETKERLDQRKLTAPAPGLVVVPMIWGEKFSPGRDVWEEVAFMKIVSTQAFEIDASVDEPVSAVLKIGAVAWVTLDAFPHRVLPGRVTFIGKSPRQPIFRRRSQFKKFPVTVSVRVASLPVCIGLKGRVMVAPARKRGVFLPRDLLGGDEASPTVRLKGPWGISVRPVRIEAFDADFVRWLDPPASAGTVLF